MRSGHFANGNRLTRQQRLVSGKVQRLPEQTIGGDAITFGEDNEVAADDLTPCDSSTFAVADHEGTRAREIAKGVERMLRASGLDPQAFASEARRPAIWRPRPRGSGLSRGFCAADAGCSVCGSAEQ